MKRMLGFPVILLAVIAIIFTGCAVASTPEPWITKPTTATAGQAEPWKLDWEKTLDAAKGEKTVVMYTTAGSEIRKGFAEALKEKHGLEMEFVVGKGNELVERILSERRAAIYIGDVYMGGSTTLVSMFLPAGALDEMKPELVLPEVANAKYWSGNKLPFSDDGGHIFAMRGSLFVPLAINTSLVKPEEMTSYNDLLKPKFKSKIAMVDPTIGGGASSFLTIVGNYIMGYDYVRQLAKQEPFIARDERLLTEWVARGKYSILIGTKPDPVVEFEKAGAPILRIIPKEGSLIDPGAGTISMINRRPHPNAARVFVNWLLSKEGQTVYAEGAGVESAREDVSKAHLDPRLAREPGKKYIVPDEEYHRVTAKNQDLWKEIFGPLIK